MSRYPGDCVHENRKDRLGLVGVSDCMACGQVVCTHVEMDNDSTCLACGQYKTYVSSEKSFTDSGFSKTNQTVKMVGAYINQLSDLGYDDEIIGLAMDKFFKIKAGNVDEKRVLAACVWFAHLDTMRPRALSELGADFNIGKKDVKHGKSLALAVFPEYNICYITITDMVKKIMGELYTLLKQTDCFSKKAIDFFYSTYDDIYDNVMTMSRHIQDNWERSYIATRSAPQNIGASCIYLYVANSPSLCLIVETAALRSQFCMLLGPSYPTIDKLCKLFKAEFVTIVAQ